MLTLYATEKRKLIFLIYIRKVKESQSAVSSGCSAAVFTLALDKHVIIHFLCGFRWLDSCGHRESNYLR